MPLDLRVRGWQTVERGLRRLARDLPTAAQQALRVEAEVEMTEAKARTPVRTGALRASGRVEALPGGALGVRWAFGGPAIDYAIEVHENLTAFHPVGQAKYLESVLQESAPYLLERVARRMRSLTGA
jgi:hypothetical protein